MKKIKKRVLFTNEFGETMTLVVDKDNNVFFKHDDIITEFEAYNDILMNYKLKGKKKLIIGYKYIFSRIEKADSAGFGVTHLVGLWLCDYRCHRIGDFS